MRETRVCFLYQTRGRQLESVVCSVGIFFLPLPFSFLFSHEDAATKHMHTMKRIWIRAHCSELLSFIFIVHDTELFRVYPYVPEYTRTLRLNLRILHSDPNHCPCRKHYTKHSWVFPCVTVKSKGNFNQNNSNQNFNQNSNLN